MDVFAGLCMRVQATLARRSTGMSIHQQQYSAAVQYSRYSNDWCIGPVLLAIVCMDMCIDVCINM